MGIPEPGQQALVPEGKEGGKAGLAWREATPSLPLAEQTGSRTQNGELGPEWGALAAQGHLLPGPTGGPEPLFPRTLLGLAGRSAGQ